MDWETASTNTLKDSSSSNNNNENQTNSIANAAIETITINNDEFQNLNTSNFDTNLNLNLTQLNQLINLNSNDDLIDANDNKNSFSENDKSNLFEAHNNDNNMLDLDKDTDLNTNGILVDDNNNKLNSATSNMLMLNSNDTNNNDELKFITENESRVHEDDEVDDVDASKKDDMDDTFLPNLSPPTDPSKDLIDSVPTISTADEKSNSKQQSNSNRFNYKCKYCVYLTKFKAHIIEHMQTAHKLNLMQCPEQTCNKKFKDEWKLKRHLLSNRDHKPLPSFKSLTDVMKQYVDIEPQKQGFPCALCQFDLNGNLTVASCEPEQQQNIILGLLNKNTDNYLYLDTYEQLKEHASLNHPNFNMDSYFVCKQCGQVFINRYKLSCHLFNVHSGKRKRRPRVNKGDKSNAADLLKLSAFNANLTTDGLSLDDIMSRVTSSGSELQSTSVKRLGKKALKLKSLGLPERKYLCVVCNRRFKRTRDLQIHVQIMHKSITEQQKQQIQVEIQKTNLLIKKPSLLLAAQLQIQMQAASASSAAPKSEQNTTNTANDTVISGKVCFICKKVFKPSSTALANSQNTSAINASINKSFVRHMQIQHGLNEKGERLIECPVCEKSFFNKQQMERHMHTHEVWVELNSTSTHSLEESTPATASTEAKASVKLLSMPDYRDKHSILYCHECVECSLYFKSIKVLAKHKKEVHRLKPVYKCALVECESEFDTVQAFLEHAKVHTQKNIVCSRCKIKFNNKNLLRHHMKNVHYNHKLNSAGNTSSSSSCNSSNSSKTVGAKKSSVAGLTQKSSANKLLAWSMPSSAPIPLQPVIYVGADVLGGITDSSGVVDQQNKLIGTKLESKFNCPTCNKEFSSRNSLHNHLATHNTNDLRLFMCDLCGNSFKTRKDLSRHAALHDYSKHKTCQDCGMTFKTSFHLKRHSLTRHSNIRPFKCNHCDMTFARKDKLKQHEAKHVNHPLYQCSQCSKGFYRKEHLKDHEISKHSKQYPFSCEHCAKGFVHAKDLHRHIRVRHLGVILNSSIPNEAKLNGNISANGGLAFAVNSASNAKPIVVNLNENDKLNKAKTAKNGVSVKLNTATNQQPQAQIISASSNDFKSKKISSILKSTMYMSNQAQQTKPPSAQVFQPQQQPQIQQQLGQHQAISLGMAQTFQITNVEPAKFQQPSHIYLNNQAIPATALQLNPIQITLDHSYKPDELGLVNNNGQQFISIPIYTNSNNEPLNIFGAPHQNNMNPTIISKINQISTAPSLVSFTTNSQPKAVNGGSQIQLAQPKQTAKQAKTNKNINELTNAQPKQTKKQQQKAENSSIDSTIDSILSLISGNETTPSAPPTNQFVRSYKCSYCDKDFFYENHLKKHVLSKHSQTPLYSCSACSQGFSTKATAKSHVENSHATYTCPVCYKAFNNKSHAQRHIQNIHKQSENSQLDLKPIKEAKTEAKVVDLSSANVNMLNQIQLEQKLENNASGGKADDLFNLNLNKENEQNANISVNNSDSANINLNDINLNFVDQPSFWSSLSSAPLLTNGGNVQGNESSGKVDGLNQLNSSYFISQ